MPNTTSEGKTATERPKFRIYGQSAGEKERDEVDTAKDSQELAYLLKEYRIAFAGTGYSVFAVRYRRTRAEMEAARKAEEAQSEAERE